MDEIINNIVEIDDKAKEILNNANNQLNNIEEKIIYTTM